MTDLRIHFQSQISSTPECVEGPPEDSSQDGCHVILPLREPGQGATAVRMVQFDRSGDQFILSPANSTSLREWYEAHSNTAQIQNSLRLTGSLLRTGHEVSAGMEMVYMILSQYLVTGEARLPGAEDDLGDPFNLGNAILSTFADSGDSILSRLLGRLQVIRRSSWVSMIDGMLDRIGWVNSILDEVPRLNTFRRHFFSESDMALLLSSEDAVRGFTSPSRERYDQLQLVDNFCREMVIAQALQRPFIFNDSTLRAMNAYSRVYQEQISGGERASFFEILRDHLGSLGEDLRGTELFLQDVEVLNFMAPAEGQDLTDYHIRSHVANLIGRQALQEVIREESSDANMAMDWFYPDMGVARPSFARVSDSFWRNLERHHPSHDRDSFRLHLDFPGFQRDLDLAIDTNATTRREFVLLGIAYIRRFFGSDGEVPSFRLYQEGRVRQVSMTASREELNDIRRYLRHLERQLEGSQDFSEVHLPILEAVACGIGAAGAIFAETYPDVRSSPELRLGIGTPFAAIGSAGCTALFSHYVIQPLTGYRNRPLTEGLVGLGGAIVGGAAYFLLSFFLGGAANQDAPGMRFPVDPFGP